MWGLVVISLMLLVFFFTKSKSNFFQQPKKTLQCKRELLGSVLNDFEVKMQWPFIEAYDYFTDFPVQFDGATIVKDIPTIRGLDAPQCSTTINISKLIFGPVGALYKKSKVIGITAEIWSS